MKIINVEWTEDCNIFTIECDCGNVFKWPAYYSVARCLKCLKQGLLYHNEKDHPAIQGKGIELIELMPS